jgi:hypothetical protein
MLKKLQREENERRESDSQQSGYEAQDMEVSLYTH